MSVDIPATVGNRKLIQSNAENWITYEVFDVFRISVYIGGGVSIDLVNNDGEPVFHLVEALFDEMVSDVDLLVSILERSEQFILNSFNRSMLNGKFAKELSHIVHID